VAGNNHQPIAPSSPKPDIGADFSVCSKGGDVRVAREGWPLIAIFVLVSAALGALALRYLGVAGWAVVFAGIVLSGWCVWFFRDPDRNIPADPRAVVSPADGVIVAIGPVPLPAELGGASVSDRSIRVCVFMNVFNVHVNRAPMAGTIAKLAYSTGKFFNASLDKASTHNERMAVLMHTDAGHLVAFVQIAGLVARRIVCHLKDNQRVAAGQRFGLIRFGSRVDVYIPHGSEIAVTIGQKTVAGETILARVPVTAASGPAEASHVSRSEMKPSPLASTGNSHGL